MLKYFERKKLEEIGYKVNEKSNSFAVEYPQEINFNELIKALEYFSDYNNIIEVDYFLQPSFLIKKREKKDCESTLLAHVYTNRAEFYDDSSRSTHFLIHTLPKYFNNEPNCPYLQPINPSSYLSWDDLPGFPQEAKEILEAFTMCVVHRGELNRLRKITRRNPQNTAGTALLLEGPPGTGKTTAVKVLAAKYREVIEFYKMEIHKSKWYGQTEENIKEVFDNARRLSEKERVIFIIDEIDQLGDRNISTDPEKRTVAAFIQEWEGLKDNNLYIIGITNISGNLDPAILSRFSIYLHIPLPDEKALVEIWDYYAQHLSLHQKEELANLSQGLSPREIARVCDITEMKHLLSKKNEKPPFHLYKEVLQYVYRKNRRKH